MSRNRRADARAGGYALSLLSVPLNARILRALETGPRPLAELRHEIDSPPQTTMRGHLRTLGDLGIVEGRRLERFPGSVEHELSRMGHDLRRVAKVLEAWLGAAGGRLDLGAPSGKHHVNALVDGWSSTLIRALAARPLTLTQLDSLIASLNYPSLERRLSAMRSAGLLERHPERGRGTPYAVTRRLRWAVAPLLAAARWEREHLNGLAPPISRLDIEATFLLGLPLVELPNEHSGLCRLAVDLPNTDSEHAGVQVEVRDGRIASCVSRLEGAPTASVSGSVSAWLRAAEAKEPDLLEISGDCSLARALLERYHLALFGQSVDRQPQPA